ncbi:MAG: hypothetical protein CVU07_14380, partial [Bacteroidetes bacterium HGW-Bacteroidetes-23]
WYNESVNEKKLDKFNEEIHYAESSNSLIDNASNDFNEAQISLQDYLQFRDVQSLENYFSLLDKMTSQLDTVHFTTDENEKLKRTVNQQKYLQYAVDKLKFRIDSIFKNPEIYLVDTDGIPLKLNKINYKDILDSVEVESHLEADSLARKGLFTRVMNALSGKIEIKKETLKQKVTMKYGKVEESGSVEEQFENVFENSDKHYQQQFQIIKSNYEKLRKRDAMLIAANRNLSDQSKALLGEFKNYFLTLGTESKEGFKKQLTTNQTIRFYSILGIVLIMLVLSVLLFFFTQLAFENERKLLLAQETIQQNLSFKNKIVGMLSHEIRSPLSLISIYSKKVSKKIEDADT